MAGYIFTVSKDAWDEFCKESLLYGFFTPYTLEISEDRMKPRQRKSINKVLAATFGDLVTMEPGDNVFFLSNRKIYGIGESLTLGSDCKYDNYYDASALLPNCKISPDSFLTTKNTRARWVVFFAPSPYFFKKGVDMDDVLKYRPSSFKALRSFEGLSFIKIDDEENRALKEYISLANEESYEDIESSMFDFSTEIHNKILGMDLTEYELDITKAIDKPENKEYVISEMLIESLLLQELYKNDVPQIGKWNYLTHQLIASPFKPLQYIDKMDIFAYKYSSHYAGTPKLVTKYLVVELKKDKINIGAVKQVMQYVDWICNEYAAGDYSKIEAYIVGKDVARNLKGSMDDECQRSYISETHPVKTEKWNNVKLIKYDLDKPPHFSCIE